MPDAVCVAGGVAERLPVAVLVAEPVSDPVGEIDGRAPVLNVAVDVVVGVVVGEGMSGGSHDHDNVNAPATVAASYDMTRT